MLDARTVGNASPVAPPIDAGARPRAGTASRAKWFQRLLDKIGGARFETEPFRHLYIRDLFDEEHFAGIVSSPEVAVHGLGSDEELFKALFGRGYKIIDFPGCVTNMGAYIRWHRHKEQAQHGHNNTACEGFGMTLRLTQAQSPFMKELVEFMEGDAFQDALARKFGVERSAVHYDCGIQKYLDGYEISPHPDIRKKALTYMVNVNPGRDSESREHHTHYLRFRDRYQYVRTYWEGNPQEDRCWVPWSWCETVKQQRENNSIVIFSPDNTTMHAVKARYDHLASQRTQLYGNFWYREDSPKARPEWEDLVIHRSSDRLQASMTRRLKAAIPPNVKTFIKTKILNRGGNVMLRGK